MKNFRQIKHNLLFWKTFGYRIFRVISNLILFGFIVGNWSKALSLSIWLTVLATLQYWIYDVIFHKFFKVSKDNGFVLWFTGLPCSGKSTIADALVPILKKEGLKIERLDGDIVRRGKLSNDLGFSKEDRDKNINRITFVSKVLSRNGIAVLASFVSPYEKTRQNIRENVTNFVEVFVNASSEECAKRDVKGMWAKAKAGEIKGFTGHDDPYESPRNPEIVLNTEEESLEESVAKVIYYLRHRRFL